VPGRKQFFLHVHDGKLPAYPQFTHKGCTLVCFNEELVVLARLWCVCVPVCVCVCMPVCVCACVYVVQGGKLLALRVHILLV